MNRSRHTEATCCPSLAVWLCLSKMTGCESPGGLVIMLLLIQNLLFSNKLAGDITMASPRMALEVSAQRPAIPLH